MVSPPISIREIEKYKQTRTWQALRKSWIGGLARTCRGCKRELWAKYSSQAIMSPTVGQLTNALKELSLEVGDKSKDTHADDSPVFLLSTAWRAGSTLLQRILLTDSRLLLWGEPMGEMTIFSRMTEMISHSICARNRQLWRDQPDPDTSDLSRSWIANLYPSGNDFRSAMRSVFDQWLREPALRRGFSRWGFKEVRLGAAEATFLHWLYPNAKFLVISRHPYNAYRSLSDSGWDQVYFRYPDAQIDAAVNYARHWNSLAVSWGQLPADFPLVHIKYEDLIGHQVDFRSLEKWLDLKIEENRALSVSVGKTATRAKLAWYERLGIRSQAADGMRALGYS